MKSAILIAALALAACGTESDAAVCPDADAITYEADTMTCHWACADSGGVRREVYGFTGDGYVLVNEIPCGLLPPPVAP